MIGKKCCLAWIFALLFPLIGSMAQETPERMRGIKKPNAPTTAVTRGDNYMFVIGIDNYQHWLTLRNAASDAKGIEEIFAEKFGFRPVIPALYNEKATYSGIMNSFDDIREELKPDDNLIVFYAGHGETRVDTVAGKVRETGYLVPVDGADASERKYATYISINEFLTQVALLPARHITVILDACHSGIAMGGLISSTRGGEKGAINSLMASPSRRVLTSARKDQLANDDGPLPNHSLFTGMLIKGLRNGAADVNGDGMVLTTELGLYLSQAVRQESNDRQTPDFGTFLLDERGEMVMDLESSTPSVLLANANAQLAAGKTLEFLKTMKKVEQLDNLPKNAYYLQFRSSFIKNQIDSAEMFLQKRLDADPESEFEEGSIEQFAYVNLKQIKKFMDYWQEYLVVETEAKGIVVELIHEDTSVVAQMDSEIHGRFALPTNADFHIRVTNNSDKPVYIFNLFFDPYGRGSQKYLWKDLSIFRDGLKPGASTDSFEMTHFGTQGLKEFRLFFSGGQMLDFFKPADVMRDGEKANPPDDLTIFALRLVFDRASRTYH